jgi:hypothetical protein
MKKALFVLCILAFFASVAVAADSELKAKADTKINENEPTTNYGKEQFLEIWGGQLAPYTPAEQALIYFDENIFIELRAANATIDFAMLKLYVTYLNQSGEVKTYRVAGTWNETVVTWDTRPDSNLDIISMGMLPPGPDVWFQTEVTEMVRSWVEATFPVHGFYVTVPQQGNAVGCQFASIDLPDSAFHPRLFIEYHQGVVEEDLDTRPDLHLTSITTGTIGINLSLPSSSHATLKIYDASGTLIETLVDGQYQAGEYHFSWSASPGVYFARFVSGSEVIIRKFVCVR